jgi:hypothetical protein
MIGAAAMATNGLFIVPVAGEEGLALRVPASALKFAVDRRRKRLYVSAPEEATVVATGIGEVPEMYRD